MDVRVSGILKQGFLEFCLLVGDDATSARWGGKVTSGEQEVIIVHLTNFKLDDLFLLRQSQTP